MGRLRVAFALLAAALLLPAGLFARRALEAQAAERAARHEALAARVFDEMERALSDFVRREEVRPVGHYGFSWVPEGSVAGLAGRARTPLSLLPDDPDAPFVVGWFQIDPDGSVHSPLVPRLDEAPLGSPPRADAPARAALVREIVSAALHTGPAQADVALEKRRAAPSTAGATPDAAGAAPAGGADAAPGAGDPFARATVAKPEPEPAPPGSPAPSAFEALRSLNRGAQAREERAPRVLEGPAAEAGRDALAGAPSLAASAPDPEVAPPRGSGTEARAAARESPGDAPASKDDAAHAEAWDEGNAEGAAAPVPAWSPPARAERPQATARSDAPAERRRRSPEAAARARARRGDPVPRPPAAPARVVVDPFVGRLAGAHVVLLRTVLVDGRGTRQGVVLDASRLAARLRDVSVGAAVLPAARLAFEPGGAFALGPDPAGAFSFGHRFGPPFDGVSVELALAPLAEPAGERAARWLAFLLPATGALGLLALYRMVAARLAFARRRGQFVAAVSHELKTPLTAIRLIVEMLRDGAIDTEDKRRAYYATLTAESERLSRLIDNVLEFSRLERGERALALETAPLAPAVEELSAMLGAQAARAGSGLELDLAGGLPPVRFERDALAQVLFNLVDNAQKYGRGPVSVALRAEGDRVVLAVADRGPGVPPAEQDRIFEPFERGGDELTRESQGSGLGLALVRGLAERMGAAVAARNLPSGGFEVSLAFPAPRA